jgi:hypothetical protein
MHSFISYHVGVIVKDDFGRQIHDGVAGIFFVVILFFADKESLHILPQGIRSLGTKG